MRWVFIISRRLIYPPPVFWKWILQWIVWYWKIGHRRQNQAGKAHLALANSTSDIKWCWSNGRITCHSMFMEYHSIGTSMRACTSDALLFWQYLFPKLGQKKIKERGVNEPSREPGFSIYGSPICSAINLGAVFIGCLNLAGPGVLHNHQEHFLAATSAIYRMVKHQLRGEVQYGVHKLCRFCLLNLHSKWWIKWCVAVMKRWF